MELRQLRYFIAVAEELHFGRAAERVHIAQPPLSQQIKKLEEELGARLFERTSRSVRLTREGETLLEEARAIMERIDGVPERVSAASRGEEGRVRIGFVSTAMDGNLPGVIRAFRERFPQVSLTLRELGTLVQFEELRAGRLDLGFMRLFAHDTAGLTSFVFLREPYVLAIPEGHALAALEEVPLKALDDEPLIMFPRRIQPALYDSLMSHFHQAGATPRIVQEAVGKPTTAALVASGLGAALVQSSMARTLPAGVACRPIADKGLPVLEVSAVWREDDRSPALQNFAKLAMEQVAG